MHTSTSKLTCHSVCNYCIWCFFARIADTSTGKIIGDQEFSVFLTPSSHAITENSWSTSTANPHIQIGILTSIHTMTENIKTAPLRHSCLELWISPTHKLERPVKLLVFAPLYTPTLSRKNRCWCYEKESEASNTYNTYTRRVGRYVL